MKHYYRNPNSAFGTSLLALLLVTGFMHPQSALSASVSLATSPLATSTTSSVKPNVLFIMDDSGSMKREYMPDAVTNNRDMNCYRNSSYNGVYYSPDITYSLPVKSDATYYPDSDFLAAPTDGFSASSSTVNLSTAFRAGDDGTDQAAYYYKYTGATPATPVRGTCYSDASYTRVTVSSTSGPGSTDERQNFANWYSYYRTRILMMKSAAGLAFSKLDENYRVGLMKISQTDPLVYVGPFEGTLRSTWYTELYSMTTPGYTPLRRSLSDAGKYYAGKLTGTDPIEYSCQQNFTILSTDGYWNSSAGYKLDDTAVGNQDGTANAPMWDGATAGTTVTTTYTRNTYSETGTAISGTTPSGTDCASRYRRIVITPQTRSCSVTNGTETCTSAVDGNKIYESPYTYDNATCVHRDTISAPSDTAWVATGTPVTSSGSSGGTSDTLADVAMYYYQTDLRTTDCTGAISGEDVCENNVFQSSTDNNIQQHMTTFTLGMGADGRMNYSSSYLTDTSGDYYDIKTKATADADTCEWQTSGSVCTWPTPSSDSVNNIDDLWHAAVNGRGAYFSANDPTSLSSGLSSALAGINARRGAAAAAATSTLNPVAGNNYAYVASYTTVSWKGNLEARSINTETGVVSVTASWCAQDVVADTCASPSYIEAATSGDATIYNCVTPDSVICTNGELDGTNCKVQVATACSGTMNARVSDASDTRTIKTANSTGTGLVDFTYANLSTTQKTYFDAAHIGTLSQWADFTADQKTAAAGNNLVNFLRGQYGYENRNANAEENRLYRFREAVLGDALESQPAFMANPVFSYPYPGYSTYKDDQVSRAGKVYLGANDGMLHAFDAATGAESWAYVPSMVIPNMWKLAEMNYGTSHANFVNGSPVTSDICYANCNDPATAVWKTILVAGLNGGGRGYYALDITDPASPALLWEFTTTAGIGSVTDDDVGFGFGQAIITRKNDGTWVVLVTSGYNNTSPGDGMGYLYVLDAASGDILSKISTGVGSTTTPSGLAKIAGYNEEPGGNKAGYIYGGDLLGNVWRFDINSSTTAAIGTGDKLKFATLYSETAGTTPQPIMTTPVLGKINGKRYIFISTGKYLEQSDLTTTQPHSMYSIKDDDATTTLVNPRLTLIQQTLTNNLDGTRSSTSHAVDTSSTRGCFVDFPDSGERANIDAKLVQGILIAPTIVPSNTACNPGGYGWLNYFDYATCGGTAVKYDSTIVGINVIYIDDPIVQVVTSENPTPDKPELQPEFKGSASGFIGKRTLWRELIPQ